MVEFSYTCFLTSITKYRKENINIEIQYQTSNKPIQNTRINKSLEKKTLYFIIFPVTAIFINDKYENILKSSIYQLEKSISKQIIIYSSHLGLALSKFWIGW